MSRYYGICCRSIGRRVLIKTKDGRSMRGVIHRVDRKNVYLRPLGPTRVGGFGYGWYRPWGYGWGAGAFGWGIALGAIASLAFI
ncbi:hypothetical protein [Radiobacillus deserti]|uniref:Uncharacterized protein n=1 Tax=Radiobacillus deserti TaxID=2594883 RepID=A0A516KKE2_9BACI|nr:hypothetical protein FN924_17835 [Radiobacillus deserti]